MSRTQVPLPDWVADITEALPRANPEQEEYRPLSEITQIVVHYDAVDVPDGFYAPMSRYRSEASEHISRNWNDAGQPAIHGFGLMYHVKISYDGRVWLTQPFELVTWHARAANPSSIAVCCDLGAHQQPSRQQLDALAKVLVWLEDTFYIAYSHVHGHCEVPTNATACPGALLPYVQQHRAGQWPDTDWERDPDTGHTVARGFREYWHAHPVLGHPLTEEFGYTLEDGELWTVQLFERGLLQWRAGYPVMEARIGFMWGALKGLVR